MRQTLTLVLGAVFGVALVATCDHRQMGSADAGAQSGPSRVLTADTDVNQLVSGTAQLTGTSTAVKALDGPFVLTDATERAGSGELWTIGAGQDCTPQSLMDANSGTSGRVLAAGLGNTNGAMHGARLFIRSDETLCAGWVTSAGGGTDVMTWSGWRPY